MIYRYQNDGGLEGGEGAFTTCTFWYVECLARAGRLDARLAMGHGRSRANHLGLLSEELDKRGRSARQFPAGAHPFGAHKFCAHFLNRSLDQPSGGEWQP